jgi:hypothetical protein
MTVLSDNDDSTDGYIAAMKIAQNHTMSDCAEHHFNFTYLRFKQLNYNIQVNTLR